MPGQDPVRFQHVSPRRVQDGVHDLAMAVQASLVGFNANDDHHFHLVSHAAHVGQTMLQVISQPTKSFNVRCQYDNEDACICCLCTLD